MKILIIGSEGFIGKHLVDFYKKQNRQVYGADLMEVGSQPYQYTKISRLSPELDDLLQLTAFDVCINAGGSGNVPYSMSHPLVDFEANSLDTIRLLDALRRHQPHCRYLHISSAAVYGNPKQLPIKEESPLVPISPYGWHKLIAEQLCEEFTTIYNIPTAIVRPFSVYGPGLKKQLFWDLHQKIKNAGGETVIELWGTGKESRDFIYITSLVQLFDCIIQNGQFRGERYNAASGEEVTIAHIAQLFVEETRTPVNIRFNQQVRSGDPQNWRADIAKIRSLGFEPPVSFEQGVKQTIQWLKELD